MTFVTLVHAVIREDEGPQLGTIAATEVRFAYDELVVHTRGAREMHDISDDIRRFVAESRLAAGIVVIQSQHTTAGLLVNEWETGFRADYSASVERLIPATGAYVHDDASVRWENLCPEDAEFPNGHAHLQHAAFSTASLTLCIAQGALVLGRWQRVLLVEFDRPRRRAILLHAMGRTS